MNIKERVQRADARAVIDSVFPKPEFDLDGDLTAPARTDNYAELGAAFNYVFTFWLSANHDAPEIVRWPTNAGLSNIHQNYPPYSDAAETAVDEAEDAVATFLETGDPDAALCKAALDLARIEAAYHGDHPRAIHLLRRLGEYEQGDIEDLIALYETIPDQFTEYDRVVVNPEFGPVEVKVGGVDADVVCGGTLIDIKTTKHLSLKIGYWRKLVAYATLADAAHGLDASFPDVKTTVPELDHVGVYFSRYGLLWTVSTDRIYGHEQYKEFREWFVNLASD